MCYSASYWAKLKAIYYGCSWLDYCDCAPEAPLIKEDIGKPANQASIPQIQLLQREASLVWDKFRNLKTP
jgi:tRNA(Arg) A34 adenosine deaminase TadA